MLTVQTRKNDYPPGPKGYPVLGNLLDFLRDPTNFVARLGSFGDLVHFTMGPHHAYLVNKPEYISELLTNKTDCAVRHLLSRKVAGQFIGDSLALADGEPHMRARKLMMPAFHQKRLEGYAAIMLDEVRRMLDRFADGQQVALSREMQALSMRIATRTLFGSEVNESSLAIAQAMDDFQQVLAIELHSVVQIPDWLPIAHKKRKRQTIKTLHGIIAQIIAERRAKKVDKGDLLSMLMAAVDEESGQGLTDQQVHDETVFLFIAGHETTANLLTWAPYLLDRHASQNAELLKELDEKLEGRPPSYFEVQRLSYLEQVIKETLRIYPSAWILLRTVAKDFALGPYTLPRGASLFLSPFVTHRDARYFPEPTLFRPERFAPGSEKTMPRFAYFPFGGGVTSCIGSQFAMLTAKIVLATMLQRYRLELLRQDELKPTGLATMRPAQDVVVKLRQRERQAQ